MHLKVPYKCSTTNDSCPVPFTTIPSPSPPHLSMPHFPALSSSNNYITVFSPPLRVLRYRHTLTASHCFSLCKGDCLPSLRPARIAGTWPIVLGLASCSYGRHTGLGDNSQFVVDNAINTWALITKCPDRPKSVIYILRLVACV